MNKPSYILLLTLLVAACVKDDPAEDIAAEDVYTAIDHAFTERAILPLPALVNALQLEGGGWTAITAHTCASVDSITGDTAAFPAGGAVTLHLHFPDTGCVDIDGHRRSGLLRITLSDFPGATGAVVTIRSDDLTDNDLRYRFALSDTTVTVDTFNIHIDSSFVYSSGDWGRRINGSGSMIWTDGLGDDDHSNDGFTIHYSGTGLDREGRTYSSSTTQDLRFSIACPWIHGGIESLVPAGLDPRTLDYGTGVCDAQCEIGVGAVNVGLTIP